jgi:ABC-type antimicrobial peptide transport system permease subunit
MALGAEGADVLRLVIRLGLRLVTAGVAIGLIVSLLLGRAIEAELWRGVKPYDPETFSGMTLLLVATGALACWIPARRAGRVDPRWPCATNRLADWRLDCFETSSTTHDVIYIYV